MTSQSKKEFPKNFVTLYTDATCKDGILAWAFWARHDTGRITMAGVCPPEINDINNAEMYAICHGMYKVLNMLDKVDGFYVRTDSKSTIGILGTRLHPNKQRHEITVRLRDVFDKMVNERSLTMNFKHVKSHSGKSSIKHWLNDWCDKNARLAREKYKKEKDELSTKTQ